MRTLDHSWCMMHVLAGVLSFLGIKRHTDCIRYFDQIPFRQLSDVHRSAKPHEALCCAKIRFFDKRHIIFYKVSAADATRSM